LLKIIALHSAFGGIKRIGLCRTAAPVVVPVRLLEDNGEPRFAFAKGGD